MLKYKSCRKGGEFRTKKQYESTTSREQETCDSDMKQEDQAIYKITLLAHDWASGQHKSTNIHAKNKIDNKLLTQATICNTEQICSVPALLPYPCSGTSVYTRIYHLNPKN